MLFYEFVLLKFKFCFAFQSFCHRKFVWLLEVYGAKNNGNCPIMTLPIYASQTIRYKKQLKLHKTHTINITRSQRKLRLLNVYLAVKEK